MDATGVAEHAQGASVGRSSILGNPAFKGHAEEERLWKRTEKECSENLEEKQERHI